MYYYNFLHRNIIHFRGIFEGDLKDFCAIKAARSQLENYSAFLMNFQKFYDNLPRKDCTF